MILKLSIAASVIAALLTAFLFVRSTDEVVPRGTTQLVTVWDSGTRVTPSEARAVISTEASRSRLPLYKSVVSTADGHTRRILYVMNSATRSDWNGRAGHYADVGRSVSTRYAPGAALPARDVGGLYVTDGSLSSAQGLVRALSKYGIEADVRPFGPLEELSWASRSFPLGLLTLAGLLSLLVGCVYGVVSARRANAILLAGGASPSGLFAFSVSKVLIYTGVAGVGGLLAGAPALWLYNGLAQFERIVVTAMIGVGAVALAAIVFTAVAFVGEAFVSPVAALGRKRPLRPLSIFDAVVYGLALALTLVSLSGLASVEHDVSSNRRDAAAWSKARPLVSVTFRATDAEYDSIESTFARISSDALARGRALIVSHSPPPTVGHGPEHGNSLVVDEAYIAAQRVIDYTGHRVVAASLDPHALTLLIPENLRRDQARIVEEYRAWMKFQLESRANSESSPAEVPINVAFLRNGQSLFNYATLDATSRQTDSVVAVLPTASTLVSDNWLVANATTGGLLFSDDARLAAEIRRSGLAQLIGGLEHVTEAAAVRLGDQERILRAQIFGCALAAFISAMSSVILASAMAERRRRSDFTLTVHGSSLRAGLVSQVATLIATGGFAVVAASLVSSGLATNVASWGVVAGDISLVTVMLVMYRRRLFADTRDHS